MRKALLLLLLCCFVAAISPALYADDFAQWFNGAAAGAQLSNGPFTLGWSFNVVNPNGIQVTDLAVYVQGGAALLESHDVGIWDSTGTLVDSATIPAGGGILEVDQGGAQTWRDVFAPVFLAPGTYTIGATWNNNLDPMIFDVLQAGNLAGQGLANFNGPGVVLIANAYIAGGFAEPLASTGDAHSYFGPNFETVPEPGTLIMLGTGVLGLAGALRRKINL